MGSVIEKFNEPGHYYTSYPSLGHWKEFGDYARYFSDFIKTRKPLHLYCHIPFCAKLCHYCICNVVISSDRQKIQFFLDHLLKEIRNLRKFYEDTSEKPAIEEVHFGGGTPSHLDREQFKSLFDEIVTLRRGKFFREVAMEIDPRTVKTGDLQFYAGCGVDRVSYGIQDFDAQVQKAINREQPYEMIEALMEERKYFRGVNFDLLYGLPFQTLSTIEDTVEKVLNLRPDRVTVLKYCHAPEVRRHMKLIDITKLPKPEELPVMFLKIANTLMDSGYVWVGLDHFCLPTDSLSKGELVRTFNGFKSGPVKDMIGVGPTSTGAFGRVYAQNHYDLNQYYNLVNEGEFPVERGYVLTEEDEERRKAIFGLLCSRDIKPEARLYLRNLCKFFDNKDVEPEHMKIAQKTITRRAMA